mgnify:CR=1 FL=1
MNRTMLTACAIVVAALAFLFAPLTIGCSANPNAVVASSIAVAANTALDVLTRQFERDMTDAILMVADRQYPSEAARNDAINRAGDDITAQWIAVWGDPPDVPNARVGAWTTFRLAHDTWAVAIERGEDGAAQADKVRTAYCALVAAVPQKARHIMVGASIVCVNLPDAGVLPIQDGGVR